MSKRGRPRIPPERRREVRITINVTEDVAEGVFLYAKRTRQESLSNAIARVLERLARREQELLVSAQH